MTDYKTRLTIPSEKGNSDMVFTTKQNVAVAIGYERIVIGERGPYIEFKDNQIQSENIHIPLEQMKRKYSELYYYIEYRSNDDCKVKIYQQKKIVNYADYKVGYWYVSPFDLLGDGKVIIEKLKKGSKNAVATT